MTYAAANLRPSLMKMAGEQMLAHDDLEHEGWKDIFETLVAEYVEVRKKGLKNDPSTTLPAGLTPIWENKTSEHSGQRRDRIYWRQGNQNSNTNPKNSRNGGRATTTHIQMSDPKSLAYFEADFEPYFKRMPQWERTLVMHYEIALRVVRRDMQRHQKALREYLHVRGPTWPPFDGHEVLRKFFG